MGRKLSNDYTGTLCGCWKVIERDWHPKSKSHETFWIAECQNCGNIASVRKTDLDKNPSSCNNCKGDFSTISKIKKYNVQPGDKFGYLIVLDKPRARKPSGMYVKCQCQCGNIVEVRIEHLLGVNHSRTISCGCASRSSGEVKIAKILQNANINYAYNYVIADFSKYAPFDFAIFDANNQLIELVEYDGEQHYRPVEYFGGEDKYKQQQERDDRKNEYCRKQGIKLKRIPYWDYDKLSLEYILS